MKEVIKLKPFGGTASQVAIGDVIEQLGDYLPQRRIIVITDSNVHRHYRKIINQYEYIIVGIGETQKTLVTVEKIYHQLLTLGADRECFILGMGGGIVTDIAGFAASTYMRGVRFGFVATTLLAQVDASVGGKNGVNVKGYKNMVGTFNQPEFVICDTSTLKTLPQREVRAGMAEIIKSGIIADKSLYEIFRKNSYDQIAGDDALLTKAISAAVRVKAKIVEADERESGERKKLNLGHTFAHAIEKTSGVFLHGEAVAIGTAMIADLSVKMGVLDVKTAVEIKETIRNAGLPTESGSDVKRLLKALKMDKKRDNDQINLVLIHSVGDCRIHKISFSELESTVLG